MGRTIHGYYGTSTYYSWYNMKKRCNDANHSSYKNYGGRGIKYLDRWESFCNFLEDMGPKPSGRSLDRVDNNGNYTPKNCRWATRSQQDNNSRRNRLITIAGVTKTITQWCGYYSIKRPTVYARMKSGLSEEQALTLPVNGGGWGVKQNLQSQ